VNARRNRVDIRQAGRPIQIVLTAWLVLVLAFFFAFVRPKVRAYDTLQRDAGPKLQALERQRAATENREDFLAALKQAEKDLETLRSDVLSTREERMVEVQAELDDLASAFRIDLEQVAFDNEILADEELDRLVMVVPLQGSYSNLRNFLQAVESSEKFLIVERVALAEGKEGGVQLQLNITLATYFDAPAEIRRERKTRRQKGNA
jgi:Tfp pilus assembly protein PilO